MLVSSFAKPDGPWILHHPELDDAERGRRFGRGAQAPLTDLVVDERRDVTFEFVPGAQPVRTGGELLVAWRWPFDWGDLQTADPAAEGHLAAERVPASDGANDAQTARDDDQVVLAARYEWIGGIEPWHHIVRVRVESGTIAPGDTVRVRCTRWAAPTVAAPRAGFLLLVDHEGDGRRVRLADPPEFRIRPDRAARLVVVAPSDIVAGAECRIVVRCEDRWGNATEPPGPLDVALADPAANGIRIERIEELHEPPVRHVFVRVDRPGDVRLAVGVRGEDGATFAAESNPVRVHATAPELRLLWGDLHSGQSEIGCGCGTIEEHYAFARDVAGLEIVTHQANDHYVTRAEWDRTRRATEACAAPGRFVPILGCEWSAFTQDGGDRNVFYAYDEPRLRRSDRFFLEQDPDPEPDLHTAPEFLAAFRDLDVLVNMHVGGRMTNLDWHEPAIERLCEVHSTHGTVEWFVRDALTRGYRFGVTAGSDGVTGRPGADHPGRRLVRNVRNGLTGVWAEEATCEAVWRALQERRCYATTGERIRLEFEIDGRPMGSELRTTGPFTARVRIAGTAAIERVDLLRGTEVARSWAIAEPSTCVPPRLRVLWGGTENKGSARAQRVTWDGSLAVDRGTLRFVEPVALQTCADTFESIASNGIRWKSATAGNATGAIVEVAAEGDARLEFRSGPASFEVPLRDVLRETLHVPADGTERFVEIGPAPRTDGPSTFAAEWTESEQPTGTTPWWIRVVQTDRATAWSSPVYVAHET